MNIGSATSKAIDISTMRSGEKTEGGRLKVKTQEAQSEKKVKEEKVDLESLRELMKNANEKMKPHDTQLELSLHEKTKQIMIKVIDTVTDETIVEIPSRKLVDIMENLIEVSGILIDVKA